MCLCVCVFAPGACDSGSLRQPLNILRPHSNVHDRTHIYRHTWCSTFQSKYHKNKCTGSKMSPFSVLLRMTFTVNKNIFVPRTQRTQNAKNILVARTPHTHRTKYLVNKCVPRAMLSLTASTKGASAINTITLIFKVLKKIGIFFALYFMYTQRYVCGNFLFSPWSHKWPLLSHLQPLETFSHSASVVGAHASSLRRPTAAQGRKMRMEPLRNKN